jgi:hypothetical protein
MLSLSVCLSCLTGFSDLKSDPSREEKGEKLLFDPSYFVENKISVRIMDLSFHSPYLLDTTSAESRRHNGLVKVFL